MKKLIFLSLLGMLFTFSACELLDIGEGKESPSFTITSFDLTNVFAITGISTDVCIDESGRTRKAFVLCTISNDGDTLAIKLNIESDDEDFKKYFEDNVVVGTEIEWNLKWIAGEYLVLEEPRLYSKTPVPEAYENALREYLLFSPFIFRASDGKVFSIDDQSNNALSYSYVLRSRSNHILYQQTYYQSRKAYNNGKSIFIISDGGLYRFDFGDNKITGEYVWENNVDAFWLHEAPVLIDKDNNFLYYHRGDVNEGYILCHDKRMIPFMVPQYFNDEVLGNNGDPVPASIDRARFFEVDYTWYFWAESASKVALYKVSLENNKIVYTELNSTYNDKDVRWGYELTYFRRGNKFIFGDVDFFEFKGEFYVVDMDENTITRSKVDDYHSPSYVTPDGYSYDLQNGTLYKYDLLSGKSTAIVTNRDKVPAMTATEPRYDEIHNCFYESGVRHSDSESITVITDAETGEVVVVEGVYNEHAIYVRLPKS